MTYGYGHIATRGDDLWSELHRARVTLLAPDRFFLGRDSASVFRITGMDSTAPVGVCGARQVRLARCSTTGSPAAWPRAGRFMLHTCGTPLWRSETGMVFTATLGRIRRVPGAARRWRPPSWRRAGGPGRG